MIPKVKEKWRKEATIKIKTLLKVTENPKGCFSNDEQLINISIDKCYVTSSFSFVLTKKGKKDALKFLKEELYL
jgi:hypothetical protein